MPTDATLTKTERNALLQGILEHKFAPTEFVWSETKTHEFVRSSYEDFISSKLTHRTTEHYTIVGGVQITCSPGPNRKVESWFHEDEWGVKIARFDEWLSRLRREVDEPDLWEAFLKEKKLAELSGSVKEDNRPFTKPEKDYIAKHLQEIKRYLIATQETNATHQHFIESRIEYLIEAPERMGRKDWHILLMGVMATLVIAAVVTPERAQELFRMIADAFLPLFQSLLQLEG